MSSFLVWPALPCGLGLETWTETRNMPFVGMVGGAQLMTLPQVSQDRRTSTENLTIAPDRETADEALARSLVSMQRRIPLMIPLRLSTVR